MVRFNGEEVLSWVYLYNRDALGHLEGLVIVILGKQAAGLGVCTEAGVIDGHAF